MKILVDEEVILTLLAVALLSGVLTLLLSRMGRPCRGQTAWQMIYLAMLMVVGGLTVFTLGSEYWLWCSGTLATMIVGGTVSMNSQLPTR